MNILRMAASLPIISTIYRMGIDDGRKAAAADIKAAPYGHNINGSNAPFIHKDRAASIALHGVDR